MLKTIILFFLVACSSTPKPEAPVAPSSPKEFSRGELILGTELLTKIFDQQMAPLKCVPNIDEASLLLRTIRPRMEIVEDDMEAILDNQQDVAELINTCEQNCTCSYIDELLREHLVPLTKAQRKILSQKNNEKEINRCLSFVQTTFCQSELYKTLNEEKMDFSFEEAP